MLTHVASNIIKRTPDSISRDEVLASLTNAPLFDIVVIGGGIHGAEVARLAAGLGFSVSLFEKNDYAAATSSRSSKMAHGGLRYLELFDFEQVFEGIRAREEMFEHVGHLVKPAQFLIPVPKQNWWLRAKLGIGLHLYDLLTHHPERRHKWIPRAKLSFPGFHGERDDLMGCYMYTDGIMSDTRLVVENILAARRYGATCLNYCEVTQITRKPDGISVVSLHDRRAGTPHEVQAKVILNCTGPWAASVAETLAGEARPLRFSRGSHIIFTTPWRGPSLFLPLQGRARYYFVWPHPAGTLVGTTEREVSSAELDPLPSPDEIEEILKRVERDLPNTGLNRSSASYCYAGIRTLPTRGRNSASSVLSRKHVWTEQNNVVTLFGGKYTTAAWTAREGVTIAANLLGHPLSPKSLSQRLDLKQLPGSVSAQEAAELRQSLLLHGVPSDRIDNLLSRYGKRLGEHYLEYVESSPQKLIELETRIALDTEQAESLEDLLRRRLELEYTEDHGERFLDTILPLMKAARPDTDVDHELETYRARMKTIHSLLGKT